MAKLNKTTKGTGVPKAQKKTHEGAPAFNISKIAELKRSVMACMLWEDGFYESGQAISTRIATLIKEVDPKVVAQIAKDARNKQHLRHVPLLVTREMARATDGHKMLVAETLNEIIQRPDELKEFLAIYWKEGKQALSNQVKKGLASAFTKFDEYSLAKYNSADAIKLRDVMFMVHPKPLNKDQEKVWKKLVDNTLAIPDTWETNLSAGKDKKATFERLIREGKLGGLAFIRNLRGMLEAGVDETFMKENLLHAKVDKILPFRYVAAARHVPTFEGVLEKLMLKSLQEKTKLPGKTIIVVDVSGSMFGAPVSAKSDIDRFDAGAALAVIMKEICEHTEVYTFSNNLVRVADRRGFALIDAMKSSQSHGGTELGKAMTEVNQKKYDRVIVFTDEQSHDRVGAPAGKGYMVNVACHQNGVGYGPWTHIDGFSEAIVDYILQYETID